MMLRFVIWGVGYRGKMLLKCLENRVMAFIDNNTKLQGTFWQGIPIISFQSYLEHYRSCFIVVSPAISPSVKKHIIDIMRREKVGNYFVLERSPMELPYYEASLPFDEMLLAINGIHKNESILCAGINLYSLLLYEHLEKRGIQVYLYATEFQKSIIHEIQKDTDYVFISDKDSQIHTCKVLLTDRFLDKIGAFNFIDSIPFYRFPHLKRYNYKKILPFHNMHSGMRCFIVATGPSLKISDLDMLHEHGEISISVNTVYNCFDITAWRPNYLVVTDTAALDIYQDEIQNADVDYKFVSDRQYGIWYDVDRSDVIMFHDFFEYYEEEGPDFSSCADLGVYYGGTVVYAALQIAVYMGFEEIYIIGADCGYTGNGRDARDHFIPNYFSKGGAAGNLDTGKMFVAYRRAWEYADTHGIKIYNATRGGKLEVFERVDFDSSF